MSLTHRLRDLHVSNARKAGENEGWRPTGQENFDAMTKAEQDEAYGADIAEALRNGDITLADLVHREGGFISQKPAQDVLPKEES